MKMLTRFSWKTSFEVFQLSWFFFLASLALSWGGNAVAQGTTMGDCSGKFTFEAWKSYDPLTNKTSFTYKVVNIGRVNGISHLSMPLACNPPTPGINIAQILVGSVALISSDGVNWSPVSSSYGEDPSENCSVGAVFKFDGSVPGDTDWYRLVVLGNWQLTPATAIIKYGPYCCTISVPNGRCLEEACPSIPVAVQSDTICVGSIGELRAVASGGTSPYTYSWSGPDGFNASGSSIYTSLAGSYMVIARDSRGCSGMGMGLLAVNPTTSSTNRLTICSNQLPYNWDGLVFTAAGEQTKAGLVNQYGCDSTALYVLSVNPTTSSTNRLTICSNQLPYNWDGLVFTAAGEQTKTGLVNQYGCDSTALYVLSVNPTTSSTNRLTICSNQLPYNWDGLVFTAAGEQTKSGLVNQYGCDSTALYVLSVNPTTSSTNRLTICSNQLPYNWDGLVFNAAGEQTKSGLVNQYGCDSTALYVLSVNPTTSSTNRLTICSNQLPYNWDGLVFTAAGEQTKTGLVNQYGCDSTALYVLSVNPTTSSTNRLTICSNQLPYNWDGLVFNAAGEQTKSGLVNQYGCDSTALYVLSVNPTTSSTNRLTICSNQLPYNWDGLVFNAAGEQTKSGLVNQYGCDSTALYVLSVNPTTSSTNRLTICSNQLPYNWDGLVFNAAGEQTKSGLVNQYGCDSTALYVLTTVNPPVISSLDRQVCIGKTLQLMATPAGGTWSGSYVTSQGMFDATNLVAGLYLVSYTISGVCTVTKQVQIRVESCLTLCTYTQGYYGNVGGIACTPNGPQTTTQLITSSLAAMPNGILYLGVAGRSFTARNAAELIRILPGGGPASLLPGGNHTASSSAILKGGRINNVLLAQTITLGLNVYMPGSTLGSLSLAGGVGGADKYLVTVEKQSGDCATLSTAIPKACTFVPTYCLDGVTIRSYTLVSNPYKSWRISAKVLQALPGNKTVMDLWQLASQALGGTLPAGLSYSEIANAVAAINEAFDGCRIWVGFSSSSSVSGYCTYPPVTVCPELPAARFGVPKANQGSANLSSTLQVEVFPNPSRGQLTFRWIAPESGKALLELFDVQGKRLAVLFDGLVTANVPYVIGYTSSASVSSVLIYKMKVGRSVVTGKIQVLK